MLTTTRHDDRGTDRPVELTTAIELLADDYARTILQCLDGEVRSAADVAERCEMSHVTAYRRLNRLEEAGLVSVEWRPAADGNHYRVYSNALETLTLSVCSNGFEGEIATDRSASIDPADS